MPIASSPDVVFHVTTPDRAERILTEGLHPYKTSECSPRARAIDAKLDSHRPPGIVALGVSRLGSAYAHPDSTDALVKHNGGWLSRAATLAMLAVIVDPATVYVCDGLLVMQRHTPEEFWGSLKALRDYREEARKGEPVFEAPFPGEPKRWGKFVYFWPEVLLPGGAEAAAIELVRSR